MCAAKKTATKKSAPKADEQNLSPVHVVTSEESAFEALENHLWASAEALRGSIDSSEFRNVVLSLLFIKFASDRFDILREHLINTEGLAAATEPLEYQAQSICYVAPNAHWTYLIENAKSDRLAHMIDAAMAQLEQDNDFLNGTLDAGYFVRTGISNATLAALMAVLSQVKATRDDQDVIGRVYEYFLGKFAQFDAKGKGEFYTPKFIVDLMAELIEPYNGRLYDPACGTGGMFVQSINYILAHKGSQESLFLYGQEKNKSTYRLAKMNLAMRGMFNSNLGKGPADTFHDDLHRNLKVDFVMANPPFNLKDWRKANELTNDDRWQGFPVPPAANANYAWLLHILSKLNDNGVAGVLLASGSLNDGEVNEKTGKGKGAGAVAFDIRKQLIDSDLIEAIVMLPSEIFYSTNIAVPLWILNKNKGERTVNKFGEERTYRDRRGEVLFINLMDMGHYVNKNERVLSSDDINKAVNTLHNWQLEGGDKSLFEQPGFCRSVHLADIAEENYDLTVQNYVEPALYVPETDFDAEVKRLAANLTPMLEEAQKLNVEVLNILKVLSAD